MTNRPGEERRGITIAGLMGLLALVGLRAVPCAVLYDANQRPHREARESAERARALLRPGMTLEEALALDTEWDWAGVGTDGGYGARMFSYRGYDTRGKYAIIHVGGREQEWQEWIKFDELEEAIAAIRADPDRYGTIDELYFRWTVYEASYTLRLGVDDRERIQSVAEVERERW